MKSKLKPVFNFISGPVPSRRLPEYSISVLTNGTLFHSSEVRDAVAQADRIIASFDAATDSVFQIINRPHPSLINSLDRPGRRLGSTRNTGSIQKDTSLYAQCQCG